jgi:ABC-type bacteriocin/lantibiotic exporter with double-glycine peptidase domain
MSVPPRRAAVPPTKPRPSLRSVLPLVSELVRPRKGLLALGFLLMAVNRIAALVLPYSTRFLIDNVVMKRHVEVLKPLVFAVLVATLIQGITSFSLTQLLSKAAQRLITELRQKVQAHVGRLSVSFHDSTNSGVLVSRIMTDV